MAEILRPGEYGHTNQDKAFTDSNSVRGGRRVVADRAGLYALAAKADQLKENVTIVRVLSDSENSDETTELLLIDDSQIGSPAGWQVYSAGGNSGTPTDPGTDFVLYPGTGQNTDGSMTQKATTDALAGKVDKVAGQGLISDTEKARLAAISQYTDAQAQQANDARFDVVEGSVAGKADQNHTHTASQITDFATAADGRISAQKAQPNGLATLGSDGKVPATQLPAAQTAGVTSVNTRTGAVALTKSDVGLANVDNTSDANKPISTATQTALDGKASATHNHDGRYVQTVNGIAPTNGNVDVPAGDGSGSITPVQNPGTSTTAVMSQDATTKADLLVLQQIAYPAWYQGMDVLAGQRRTEGSGVYQYTTDATNVQVAPSQDSNATLVFFYARATQSFTKLTFTGPNQAATDAASIENTGDGGLLLRGSYRVFANEIYNQGNSRFKADGEVILDGGKGFRLSGRTQAQREALTGLSNGAKVYQTDGLKGYYTYQDGAWTRDGGVSFTEQDTNTANITLSGGILSVDVNLGDTAEIDHFADGEGIKAQLTPATRALLLTKENLRNRLIADISSLDSAVLISADRNGDLLLNYKDGTIYEQALSAILLRHLVPYTIQYAIEDGANSTVTKRDLDTGAVTSLQYNSTTDRYAFADNPVDQYIELRTTKTTTFTRTSTGAPTVGRLLFYATVATQIIANGTPVDLPAGGWLEAYYVRDGLRLRLSSGASSGAPADSFDPYDVPAAKRIQVVDADSPAVLETDELYYGKEFTDEVYGPNAPCHYVNRPSAQSDGSTAWKWLRFPVA